MQVLKTVGFKWKKFRSKRKLSTERPEIVIIHYKYLVQIKSFQESGRTQIDTYSYWFLDDTWGDSNITVDKYWQSKEGFGVLQNYSTGNFCSTLEVPVVTIMGDELWKF